MRNCLICNERTAELGENLCEECGASLASTTPLVPEQIISSNTTRSSAALLDQWGRPHYLGPKVALSRQVGIEGVAILHSSVSREHAVLACDGEAWSVRDESSTNGTKVGDHDVEGVHALSSGDQLTVGTVGFFFVTPTDGVRDLDRELAGETVKPGSRPAVAKLEAEAGEAEESTFAGLPEIDIYLVEPTGGGGGIIGALGKTIQLTTTQFEFVAALARRMVNEAHQPDLVRGFVRSSELLTEISWDTAHPSENHVKQLVRRVRRALVRGEIGNLIESRHRFGYRFRVIPRFVSAPESSPER